MTENEMADRYKSSPGFYRLHNIKCTCGRLIRSEHIEEIESMSKLDIDFVKEFMKRGYIRPCCIDSIVNAPQLPLVPKLSELVKVDKEKRVDITTDDITIEQLTNKLKNVKLNDIFNVLEEEGYDDFDKIKKNIEIFNKELEVFNKSKTDWITIQTLFNRHETEAILSKLIPYEINNDYTILENDLFSDKIKFWLEKNTPYKVSKEEIINEQQIIAKMEKVIKRMFIDQEIEKSKNLSYKNIRSFIVSDKYETIHTQKFNEICYDFVKSKNTVAIVRTCDEMLKYYKMKYGTEPLKLKFFEGSKFLAEKYGKEINISEVLTYLSNKNSLSDVGKEILITCINTYKNYNEYLESYRRQITPEELILDTGETITIPREDLFKLKTLPKTFQGLEFIIQLHKDLIDFKHYGLYDLNRDKIGFIDGLYYSGIITKDENKVMEYLKNNRVKINYLSEIYKNKKFKTFDSLLKYVTNNIKENIDYFDLYINTKNDILDIFSFNRLSVYEIKNRLITIKNQIEDILSGVSEYDARLQEVYNIVFKEKDIYTKDEIEEDENEKIEEKQYDFID